MNGQQLARLAAATRAVMPRRRHHASERALLLQVVHQLDGERGSAASDRYTVSEQRSAGQWTRVYDGGFEDTVACSVVRPTQLKFANQWQLAAVRRSSASRVLLCVCMPDSGEALVVERPPAAIPVQRGPRGEDNPSKALAAFVRDPVIRFKQDDLEPVRRMLTAQMESVVAATPLSTLKPSAVRNALRRHMCRVDGNRGRGAYTVEEDACGWTRVFSAGGTQQVKIVVATPTFQRAHVTRWSLRIRVKDVAAADCVLACVCLPGGGTVVEVPHKGGDIDITCNGPSCQEALAVAAAALLRFGRVRYRVRYGDVVADKQQQVKVPRTRGANKSNTALDDAIAETPVAG